MTRIYFDLDGVLADFQAALSKISIFKDYSYPSASDPDLEEKRRLFWRAVESITDFWESIPKMKDAEKMVKFAYDSGNELFILGLVPNANRFIEGDKYVSRAKSAKKEWILSHFNGFFNPENIIITDQPKAKVIKPTASDILIDDLELNIDKWILAGGHGILFLSIEQVIGELTKVLQIS